MRIDVSHELRPSFDGTVIASAPSVQQLHALFGPPSLVSSGPTLAPVGHRNNQRHIYNNLGICFVEHHHTRRLMGCSIVFRADSRWAVADGVSAPFSGALEIAGQPLSIHTDLQSFFRACPITFSPTMLGWLQAEHDGFSIILTMEGAKLPSGHRSRKLQMVNIELSWPHDPWGDPAIE